MIKNIIFDVGNVLVDFRWKDYMKDMGFSEEIIDCFAKGIVMNPLWCELDLGIRPEQEVIANMKKNVADYPREADLFFDKIVDIVETYPYTCDWMDELKAEGYKIYLLSNYPKWMFELHEKEKFPFISKIDGKIVSGMVKLSKPNPEIYKKLFDTYSLKPNECLFFDDRIENVEAAREQGMHAVHFTDLESAKKQMKMILERMV